MLPVFGRTGSMVPPVRTAGSSGIASPVITTLAPMKRGPPRVAQNPVGLAPLGHREAGATVRDGLRGGQRHAGARIGVVHAGGVAVDGVDDGARDAHAPRAGEGPRGLVPPGGP